ncbi:Zn(II)2Cys6 transcription factor [Aspergillus alliaceus]|uniref:Zn(II)2Cys6 transcription factor n=1 Tax=Petromyces alliaceus TaxID=209559 RepID=UPI0012A629E5|nr:Zn(II)2Cys6 transcription factor [Aspergillus alliaceus]KAB8238737.1 Zn(II)2Cys6 transcription factor [Aspergillus alliaceus]
MRGCLTCRQRHLKCDKTGAVCLRCQRSGRQCIPAPSKPEEVTFRHGQNPSLRPRGPPRYGESDLAFPDNQIWVETPPEVTFEDETGRTAADYHVVSAGESQLYLRKMSESRSSTSVSTLPPPSTSSLLSPALSARALESARSQLDSPLGLINNLLPADIMAGQQKLGNLNEAFLLRHFRRTIGAWLDVCDHERHFSVHAVERAPSCSLLLYACLATAACHLSHTNNSVPPNTADQYHEQCIAILLPVVENTDFKTSIEILLASTVILRFFEQISSRALSQDLQRHLLAGSVYIGSHIDCAFSGGLAEASFWAYVMQDVQIALATRSPLRLTIGPFEEKLRLAWEHRTAQTDRDWAHRALWLLAETINYCYQPNSRAHISSTTWEILKTKICDWEILKPDSFRPLHYSPANTSLGRPFPVVWFTSASHAMATQHICIAKALIHELRTLHFVTNANQDARIIENDVVSNLSTVLGISLSTDDDLPVRIMACHALSACGSWIRDPLSQTCLLDLLRITEAESGWPLASLAEALSQDWQMVTD